jgi:hypothetical protein
LRKNLKDRDPLFGETMARIDDYKQALALGKYELSSKDQNEIAGYAGADLRGGEEGNFCICLDFLSKQVLISWPDLEFSYHEDPGKEVSIQEKILLLHYLYGAWNSKGPAVTGDWISFQEVPDGKFYLDAFHRRAIDPLVLAFGEKPELLAKLAIESFQAIPADQGDVSIVVPALPLVPIELIIWAGDDEFPPNGNILFDRSIIDIISAEDIAWLSGMIVYPLMGMVNSMRKE